MTICIQCALEALVAYYEAHPDAVLGEDAVKRALRENSNFEEEPEAHTARVHPDLQATLERRRYLDRKASELMQRQIQRGQNCANN